MKPSNTRINYWRDALNFFTQHCWSPRFNFSLFLWDSYFHSHLFLLFAIGVLSVVTLFPSPCRVQIPGVISTFVVFRLPFLTAVSYHVTSLNAASSAIRMTWCIRTTCVGVHILSVSSVSLCLWLWNMSDCEGILLRYVNSWYNRLVCCMFYWHCYCVLVT